jgi:drug/metabolite transporter (DMT)-like permease
VLQTTTETTNNKKQLLIGSSFVLIAALGFSAKAVIIKLAYGYSHQVDAITLMALRMLIALPFFLVVGLWHSTTRKNKALTIKDWLRILILGVLGYYLASFLDFTGLKFISAGLERLILFLYPTFVILFSAIIFKRPITLREAIALLLSYAGMIWVFKENMQIEINTSHVLKGSLLVLSSSICFALFIMGSGMMVKRIGAARFTAYSMTVACCGTLMHFSINHDILPLILPPQVYGLAFIMALFSTVLPSFMMNAGIRQIGSGRAAIISAAGPIGTLFLAYFFLGEQLSQAQLLGTFLVLAGVFVASRAKS